MGVIQGDDGMGMGLGMGLGMGIAATGRGCVGNGMRPFALLGHVVTLSSFYT